MSRHSDTNFLIHAIQANDYDLPSVEDQVAAAEIWVAPRSATEAHSCKDRWCDDRGDILGGDMIRVFSLTCPKSVIVLHNTTALSMFACNKANIAQLAACQSQIFLIEEKLWVYPTSYNERTHAVAAIPYPYTYNGTCVVGKMIFLNHKSPNCVDAILPFSAPTGQAGNPASTISS